MTRPPTTANTQSSASTRSGSSESTTRILDNPYLALSHKAAIIRPKKTGGMRNPKEWEAVAFWEDVFTKFLLRDYWTNSQMPSTNQAKDAIDLRTHYFVETDDGLRKVALALHEIKRAENALPKARKGERPEDCEFQLYNYGEKWLRSIKPTGITNEVFGNSIVGPYIRFWTIALYDTGDINEKGEPVLEARMKDRLTGHQFKSRKPLEIVDIDKDYLDVGKKEHDEIIQKMFAKIRATQTPVPPALSRPNTPSNASEHTSQKSSPPKTGSPMNIDVSSSAGASPSAASRRSRASSPAPFGPSRASSPAPSGPSRARSPAASRTTVDRRSGSPGPRATNTTDPRKARQRSPLNNNQSSDS